MAAVNKIDSNATGLRIAEEESYGVLPATPVWEPLEPNSYADFGGQITTLARTPIAADRQRKKGVVTDLDSSGGFETDLTQTNLANVLQGFMFADYRAKGEEAVAAVDVDGANPDEYQVASTTGFQVDDLIQGQNFANAANNAVNQVVAVTVDTSVEVADGLLVDEPAPPADAQIVVVGHAFQSGELDVDVTGALPKIVRGTGTKDFTTMGILPGEFIYVGGDGAGESFANVENNGFKRVRSVSATELEIDKSNEAMVAETGTGLTVHLYLGRVLKNESDPTLIKRRSYQLERTLGAPDDATPADIQAEYVTGSVANEFALSIPTADKVTASLSFVGADNETIDGPTPLKSGDRPQIIEADAFNTSSDFARILLAQVVPGNEAPQPLFAFAQEISVTINNNVEGAKAVSVLGNFDVNVGSFIVGGNITAYFADVAAIDAIRANADITLDAILVKSNAGIAFDVPLITLGDGRPDVAQDQPITLPLSLEAGTGAKVDPGLNHTLMLVFYDYLPNAADT